jgi:hypothetical protein
MANQTGIAITIKAFLNTGTSAEDQYKALGVLMDAQKSGDYTKLLGMSTVEEVKAEQKTRRVAAPAPAANTAQQTTTQTTETTDASGLAAALDAVPPVGPVDGAAPTPSEPAGTVGGAQIEGDDEPAKTEEEPVEVPAFLKAGAVAA